MCLAIPMRVIALDGVIARCAARGVERDVCLLLIEDQAVAVGDEVLVHVGYAIQKVDAAEARAIWDTFDEALALADAAESAGDGRAEDGRAARVSADA